MCVWSVWFQKFVSSQVCCFLTAMTQTIEAINSRIALEQCWSTLFSQHDSTFSVICLLALFNTKDAYDESENRQLNRLAGDSNPFSRSKSHEHTMNTFCEGRHAKARRPKFTRSRATKTQTPYPSLRKPPSFCNQHFPSQSHLSCFYCPRTLSVCT